MLMFVPVEGITKLSIQVFHCKQTWGISSCNSSSNARN